MPKKSAKNKALPRVLTERQAKILAAIVREYSQTAQPVGSMEINEKYKFSISPATIRNEMMALEKMGYIEQPHTSAGRVPTDTGYRYFVNELMQRFEMSLKEQHQLRSQLIHLLDQHQELCRNIAKLLADKTNQAAFALLPEEASATGLSNVLNSQKNLDKSGVVEVVQFFENIDEYADKLSEFFHEKPEALIGTEHRLMPMSNYSLIVSKVKLPSGKTGLLGILGPKSMSYDKNMSVLEYVTKFLASGGGALVLFAIAGHSIKF